MLELCIGFWLENGFASLWFDEVVVDYVFSSRWRLLEKCDSNRKNAVGKQRKVRGPRSSLRGAETVLSQSAGRVILRGARSCF